MPQQPPTGITPNVARLLGQMNQPQAPYSQPLVPPHYGQTSTPIAPPNPAQQPDIQQLLANLTNYKPPA